MERAAEVHSPTRRAATGGDSGAATGAPSGAAAGATSGAAAEAAAALRPSPATLFVSSSLAGFTRMVQDPRFADPKAQAAGEFSAGFGVDIQELVRIGLRLGVDATFASDFSGGYYYRGHVGVGLAVGVSAPALLRVGRVDLGIEASGGFSFLAPLQTRLLTFYPSIGLAILAGLDGPVAENSQRRGEPAATGPRFAAFLPVTLSFRSDLLPVVSMGLGVRVSFRLSPESESEEATARTPTARGGQTPTGEGQTNE